MLLTVVKTEIIKLRRAPVWIAFLILPLLSAVMGTFNYLQNTEILTQKWYSLWIQHTLFACFFFLPSLIGVMCSYQWRLEHRENNWNQLMTQPVPTRTVFIGKLLVSAMLVFLTQLFTGLLYIISGKLIGFPNTLPPELLTWLAMGLCGGICIASVQLLFSMVIKNFAIPVGIALVGGIWGLMMASMDKGLFCPYSLLDLGMNANGNYHLTPSTTIPFFIICFIFILVPILIAISILKKKDIETK